MDYINGEGQYYELVRRPPPIAEKGPVILFPPTDDTPPSEESASICGDFIASAVISLPFRLCLGTSVVSDSLSLEVTALVLSYDFIYNPVLSII